ncbi:hypothetical protein [Lignipirellula cremea]|uniref:Uncharacterized protein n=1 Tax=Lignipirellula cremea TaxID=2528010 RepID=A0A518DZX1_9BACT|nr:hypothetical protein [Lignipirellula cremea]QDU97382.1 hypothetical protein Pla8534_52280 [Lignipirellula cremea]
MEQFLTIDAFMVLGRLLGFSLGVILGSFIAAIWLRIAALWMGFGKVPYLSAYKSALVSSFVMFAINFSVGIQYGFTAGVSAQIHSAGRRYPPPIDFLSGWSPTFFLCSAMISLLLTAAIFCRTFPRQEDGARLSYVDSLALAAVYYALGVVCMMLIGLLTLGVIAALLKLAGP